MERAIEVWTQSMAHAVNRQAFLADLSGELLSLAILPAWLI